MPKGSADARLECDGYLSTYKSISPGRYILELVTSRRESCGHRGCENYAKGSARSCITAHNVSTADLVFATSMELGAVSSKAM